MIELRVKSYCQNCRFFEPTVNTLFNANYAVQTIVTCENDDRCRDIYKNIKDELEECEKEKIKNERN